MTAHARKTPPDAETSPSPKWQVDEEHMALLCAFVLVLNAAPAAEVTTLALWATSTFGIRECVDCATCTEAAKATWTDPPPMRFTTAARHHRDHPSHKLRLDLDRFRVIT